VPRTLIAGRGPSPTARKDMSEMESGSTRKGGDGTAEPVTGSGISGVPWRPRTRQEEGRRTERDELRKRGARSHPNSGAGRIKDDGSDDDTIYEVKDANRSITLSGGDLYATWRRGVQAGKEAVWIIRFANGITAEVRLEMGRG
jgi:hypothetical protein